MTIQSVLWSNSTTESRMTGTWRDALPDYKNLPAPCFGACPVDGEIAVWVRQIMDGDVNGAWLTLMDNNPFPAIAGRICHHPCETACNRVQLDEAINICGLERFAGDEALANGWAIPDPDQETGKSIAIIGGGPAGLSAAYQLARRGHAVELFEAGAQLGGLLRYGIPSYRLDKSIVDGEIARITDMGVTVHLNAGIADSAALNDLHSKHDAVYIATGATRSKPLPSLDYAKPWVVDSADFLAATNADEPCELGKHLVVIGGGSAAMDVARTARRLGRKVTVLTLESDANLPAQRAEIDEANEEGIEFVCGAMLQSVSDDSQLTLTCTRVDFIPGKTRGVFEINPIDGSEFTITADAIIPSIGQDADLERWAGVLDSAGPVVQTDGQWQTSKPGIFAGGDFASMDRFVTQAVGMGKQAAMAIDAYVSQQQPDKAKTDPETPYSVINTAYQNREARNRPANAPVETRLQGFAEVQQSLNAPQALAEASRCFSCGTCIYCDNCYFYCPDMAITKLEKGYLVKTDYCKGCGLCVEECPTGSIRMIEEA